MKSLRLMGSSSMVVPFPIQSLFNRQLTSNLKTLLSSIVAGRPTSCNDDDRHHMNNCLTVSFLAHALDALVATQKLAHESLPKSAGGFLDSDREAMERYLDDDNVDLLDACNGLGEKLDNVCEYVKCLRLALHCLQGSRFPPTSAAVARANRLLESCQSMERDNGCRKVTKPSWSFSKKLISGINWSTRKNSRYDVVRSESLEEILDGSSVVTSTLCEILETALSFKSKHGHNTTVLQKRSRPYSSYSWLSSLQELRNRVKKEGKKSLQQQVWELEKTVRLGEELRQELRSHQECSSKLRVKVEELKRSCDELENGVKSLEGKVKEVYRYLMCVRMGLLEFAGELKL